MANKKGRHARTQVEGVRLGLMRGSRQVARGRRDAERWGLGARWGEQGARCRTCNDGVCAPRQYRGCDGYGGCGQERFRRGHEAAAVGWVPHTSVAVAAEGGDGVGGLVRARGQPQHGRSVAEENGAGDEGDRAREGRRGDVGRGEGWCGESWRGEGWRGGRRGGGRGRCVASECHITVRHRFGTSRLQSLRGRNVRGHAPQHNLARPAAADDRGGVHARAQ
eukprot:scaffold28410_cov112-Isochrysis_galbana.AAC.5